MCRYLDIYSIDMSRYLYLRASMLNVDIYSIDMARYLYLCASMLNVAGVNHSPVSL